MKRRNHVFTYYRIISVAVFVFATASLAQAQTQKKQDAKAWSILDYVQNLPEKYKTFEGDFSTPSKETTVIDEPHGYAAYLSNRPDPLSTNPPFPIFEIALFNSKANLPLLIVSNMKSDMVCNEYETFFLRRVGRNWSYVKGEVLPPLDLKMFWDTPKSAARALNLINGESAISYHFQPPRTGMRMKVSLEICDYAALNEEEAPIATAQELSKLIEMAKPIYLEWDKRKGTFHFAQ